MAKIKNPLFSQSASGPLAGAIGFAVSAGCQVARSITGLKAAAARATPSAGQLAQRATYQAATAAWQALTPEQRETWRPLAAALDLTPYHAYLSEYIASPNRPPFEPETYPILSAMNTPTAADRAALVNNLVAALKASGLWPKIGLLYVTAAETDLAARVNWRNPGAYPLFAINSPLFTPDVGYTGSITGGAYLHTSALPADIPEYQLGDCHISGWEIGPSVAATQCIIGSAGAALARLNPREANGRMSAYLNANTNVLATNQAPDTGTLTAANRADTDNVSLYRAGTHLNTITKPATSLPTGRFQLLRSGGEYSTRTIAAATWGASLTADDHAALYAALSTYLTALGAI